MLEFGALHGALTLMGAAYPPLKAKGCLLVALLTRNDPSSLVRRPTTSSRRPPAGTHTCIVSRRLL